MDDVSALVFARCVGFVFRAPGFSHPDVPPMVRAGLAYALSLALRHAGPSVRSGPFVLALASEVAVGFALGMAAAVVYDAAFSGGRTIDDAVGIRGSVPSVGVTASAGFGRLWSLAFTTGFFVFGGDAFAIAALANTFGLLPPGAIVSDGNLERMAFGIADAFARTACTIAAPALGAGLIAQVALASVGRISPRFATFTLSFPIVYTAALVVSVVMVPSFLPLAGRPWFPAELLRTP